ncbi:MAG: hypothetical protein NTZ24_16365 [Deltaproteobacteria bacterium]|nr:hypothetical protein [Deltaproteobacteria bacterium]
MIITISVIIVKGKFFPSAPLELKKLEAIFRHKVLRTFLNRGKITKEMIATGSSAFELSSRTGEPLTGSSQYKSFPFFRLKKPLAIPK